MTDVTQAHSAQAIEDVRALFREYGAIPDYCTCFKGFEEEIQSLPGMCAPPAGRLLLAYVDGAAAGCIGLRAMEPGYCEIRRLYVRPEFRGRRLGQPLAEAIIREARNLGHDRLLLDTLPVMKEAITLYESLGFRRIAPYRENPVEGALFMESRISATPHPAVAPIPSTG